MRTLSIIALVVCITLASGFSSYEKLIQGISLFSNDSEIQNLAKDFIGGVAEGQALTCLQCKAFLTVAQTTDQPILDIAEEFINFIAVKQCISSYNYTEAVCQKLASEMSPFLAKSTSQLFLNPGITCPFLKVCPQVYEIVDIDSLVSEIVADTPTVKESNRVNGAPTKKILHLTDVHVDLQYLAGTATTCQYPICCRNNTEPVVSSLLNSEQLSGYWGTLGNCDLPLRTFEEFTNYVQRELSEEIDLVVWTGDNVSHDEENSELSRNFNITQLLSQIMQEKFKVPVIGSFGNNDAAPDYIYDFDSNLDKELQQKTAELWKGWIDNKAYLTLKKRGFFATTIPNLHNLKVINLNTFACTEKNYVLIKDSTDPGNQLDWLETELEESESKGESVYIIGHIPINFCSENWGKVYLAIAERYQNTIKAQIFGHTHSDQFTLLPSSKGTNETIGVQFISPSLTSIGGKNPSFRVYEVDSITYEIVDYTQYRLNLHDANQLGALASPLNWEAVYKFKQNYNLTSVSLEELTSLAQNLSSKNAIYDALQMNCLTQYTPPTTYSKSLFCYTTAALFLEGAACRGANPYPSIDTKFINLLEKNWFKKIKKIGNR